VIRWVSLFSLIFENGEADDKNEFIFGKDSLASKWE
jgi:hypothetical protein